MAVSDLYGNFGCIIVQICLTQKFTSSVYDFSIVLFTALWGFLFLDQIPDYLSVIGYVVIIGTSVVKWYITIERPHRQEIHREHELNDR